MLKDGSAATVMEKGSTTQVSFANISGLERLEQKETCAINTKNFIGDWSASILIGFLVVSYARGTSVLLDLWLCEQNKDANLSNGKSFCFLVDGALYAKDIDRWTTRRNSAIWCCLLGLFCSSIGILIVWLGAWIPSHSTKRELRKLESLNSIHGPKRKPESHKEVTHGRSVIRFLIVYLLAFASVSTFRGTTYLLDAYFLDRSLITGEVSADKEITVDLLIPVKAIWKSFTIGAIVSFSLCSGASLLAPPAVFLLDGPGNNPPPIAVTILSCYYSLKNPAYLDPPHHSKWIYFLDTFVSFVLLPIFIVCYWRGVWMLSDTYLWGFVGETHMINLSIFYSSIIASVCLGLACETIQHKILIRNFCVLEIVGRIRTFVLSIGAINFWRAVWYCWDQFLGGTTVASCLIGHFLGIIGLTLIGCSTCLCAPPCTLGVDLVPNPLAAHEPLFDMVPVHWDTLSFMAIARQPEMISLFEKQEYKSQNDTYGSDGLTNEDEEQINRSTSNGHGATVDAQGGIRTDVSPNKEMLGIPEETELEIASIDEEDQYPDDIQPIKITPVACKDRNLRRRSRISAIFSSVGEDRSYYEIQRGSVSLRRNRQDLFNSIKDSDISGVSRDSIKSLQRKLRHQSMLHRNR